MTLTPSPTNSETQQDRPRHRTLSESAPATNDAVVDALCHILARIILRVNADGQVPAAEGPGGAQ